MPACVDLRSALNLMDRAATLSDRHPPVPAHPSRAITPSYLRSSSQKSEEKSGGSFTMWMHRVLIEPPEYVIQKAG
jgi:hypothetical protein